MSAFDLRIISIAVVIALIVGAGSGYMVGNSPVKSLMEEKSQLEARYDSLDLAFQRIETELDSAQGLLLEKQRENEEIMEMNAEMLLIEQENQVLHQQIIDLESQIPSPWRVINVTARVEKWMSPQAELKWEQSHEYLDIQFLILVSLVGDWAESISDEVIAQFNEMGGETVLMCYSDSAVDISNLPRELENSFSDMIEHYGLNHTGILFIGGVEIGQFCLARGPMIQELPLIAIGRDNFVRYID